MKDNLQNIDLLLQKKTDQQLAAVDWDRLYDSIQQQLDAVEKQPGKKSARNVVFGRIIAMTSAAAILLVVFMLVHDKKEPLALSPGQRAAIALSESSGAAETKIRQPVASVSVELSNRQTTMQLEPTTAQAAECTVTIIDQNGHSEKSLHPSCIIMTASKPQTPSVQTDNDAAEIACLL